MAIGCIFLGEATRERHPSVGKPVSVEEAIEHVDRGIAAGLIPQIGRVDPDPLMLGVKDRYRFLTLCFCCTCCCIAMRNMPRWSPKVKERMHALEGLRIEVTDECNGCGRCASTCPRDAISISVGDGDGMLAEAFRRIESYSDVT